MKKKQVFISYKSEEFDEALWVKNTLEAQGITCWMAPMCITGGASYAAEIPAAIQNCTVFVLILSEKVQQSKWVPRELDQAINADKTIMPFMLEDCALKDEFKFYLSNIQRYCAFQGKQAAMDAMSRDIRNLLGIPEPPEPEETNTEPPPKKAATPKTKQKRAKKAVKKKIRILPVILVAVIVPVLTLLMLNAIFKDRDRVSMKDTVFQHSGNSIQIEGQTITAADMKALAADDGTLYWISLKNCTFQTDDLSAFSKSTLYELELDGCNLTNSQLQSIDFHVFEYLSTLNLSNNPSLTDLEMIAPVAGTLSSLSIDNIGVTNLEPLACLTQLRDLSLRNLGLTTLAPINMAVYLETLIADGNQLTDLTGLENTTILRHVSLKDNRLENVDLLSCSADTLAYLSLDGNQLTTLDCLSDCSAITEFSANRNRLVSLSWFGNWTKLERLSASDNRISHIGTPPQSDNLVFLDLSRNALTDFLDFRFAADRYVTLDLSDNCLTCVTLPDNQKFRLLALHGNSLTSPSLPAGTRGLTMSIDHTDGLDAATVKDIDFTDLYIINCPPNRIVELEQASYRVSLVSTEEIADIISELKSSDG